MLCSDIFCPRTEFRHAGELLQLCLIYRQFVGHFVACNGTVAPICVYQSLCERTLGSGRPRPGYRVALSNESCGTCPWRTRPAGDYALYPEHCSLGNNIIKPIGPDDNVSEVQTSVLSAASNLFRCKGLVIFRLQHRVDPLVQSKGF